MTIGEVGNNFKSAKKIEYLSYDTFIDYDIIFIDLFSFSDTQFIYTYEEIFKRRKSDLIDFVKYKKTPIVFFASKSSTIQFDYRSYIGTHQISSLFPTNEFRIKREVGSKIDIIPNTIFTDFLNKYKTVFQYESYFESYNGIPIAEIPLKKEIVSFYNQSSLFLPRKLSISSEFEKEFISDLYSIFLDIQKKNDEVNPLPEWANNYFLPNEFDIKEEIKHINDEILIKQKNIESKNNTLDFIINKKRLFAGTGSELENEVKAIFSELDFTILVTEPNRDDLIVTYKDKVAVIEIKGVSSSAAEKYATQLEKWVSIYREANELVPKGILIVNSFKDEPLVSRNNVTFPHQMLDYSIKREHCLITTIQLLGIYLEIKKDPTQKEKLIESLFKAIGVYRGFEDWSKFISVDSTIHEIESKPIEVAPA